MKNFFKYCNNFIEKKKNLSNLLLFFLISSYWALLIKNNLLAENFHYSVVYLYIYIYLIILSEISILYYLLKFLKSYTLALLIIALFLFINFYSLSISLSNDFIILERHDKIKWYIIYLLFSVIVFFIFFRFAQVKKILIFFYIFLNIFTLFNFSNIWNKKDFVVSFPKDYNIKKNFNLYVFSIESLLPEKLLNNHLNLKNLNYIKALKENNLTVFRNHFSDNYPTRPSLNSLIYLDPVKWRSMKNNESFFSGRENSILFNFFRENNYKIITGYWDSHFGPPGPYIDQYFTFRSVKSDNSRFTKTYLNFCQFKLPWYHFQLFSYCDAIKFFFKIEKSNQLNSKKKFNQDIIDQVIDKKEKKIVFIHFYTFGHPTGNMKSYANEIIKGDRETTKIIKKTIKKILNNDKKSLLILIGDSGPLILKFSKENTLIKNIYSKYDNKKTAEIIDGHATLGAIFDNQKLCSKWTDDLLTKKFTTNSMILNNILGCMFEDEVSIELGKKIEYKLPNSENFSNYLYDK